MSRCVVKFGGSSLRGPSDAAKLASVVRLYAEPPVVVVSALYGITARLQGALDAAPRDPETPVSCRAALESAYQGAARACVTDPGILAECLEAMGLLLDRLFRLLTGIHLTGEASPRLADAVLSIGERLSSRLLASVFASAGLKAEERLPEDIGLVTDGVAGKALVDLPASREAVQAGLPLDRICVIPGFYGVSASGEACVLGRGGSDYSAAAVAWCLDAESCDLWKDVEGFMSADPAVVERARPIPRLSYAEAAELAYFGAKILHPQTVDPVERKGIPLRVFNLSAFPGRAEAVSLIGPRSGDAPGIVSCVSHTDDIAVLRLWGPAVGSRPGVLGRASRALASGGVNIKSVITSQASINFLLARADLDRAADLVSGDCDADVERVERMGGLALIAAVGEGLDRQGQAPARMLASLAAEGIRVAMCAFGASPVAAYCLVGREDEARALTTVHRAFFGT